jgi:hypothetical protein
LREKLKAAARMKRRSRSWIGHAATNRMWTFRLREQRQFGRQKGSPRQRVRMVSRSRDANGKWSKKSGPGTHGVGQRLQPKLGDQMYQDASEAVAREISEKVKGNLTTLYVLRKSPGGFRSQDG